MKNIHNKEFDGIEVVFDEPAILININRKYRENMSEDTLYEATRSSWKINLERVEKIRIACAVYRGEIKGVFLIKKWVLLETGRKEFEGEIAPDELWNKYIAKSAKLYWPYGSQNPIKYAHYEVRGKKYKS